MPGGRHSRQTVHGPEPARGCRSWPFCVLQSPYRSLVGPLVTYIDALTRQRPDGTAIVTVLLPEFVPAHWWEHVLHTQTALMLKGALLFRPRTAVLTPG